MKNFPFSAAVFEAALIPVAILVGWLLGTPPMRTFHITWGVLPWGIAATMPLLGVFWLCFKCPWRPFQEITEIIETRLMPLFQPCRMGELAVISVMAGLGEEMLFRGVLQAAVAQEIAGPWGAWLGLLIASAVFGLMHSITPMYVLLAGLIGAYLGVIWMISGNLLLPIIAHGLYDFLVLWYLKTKRPTD